MNIVFQIDGGLGKSVMATAVVEGLNKKYPDDQIIVITAYPQVFLGNPQVHKVYNHGNMPYFYQDYIEDKEIKCFLHNPYQETNYIKRSEHLLETWFSMFGLKYRGETPKLYLTNREIDFYSKEFIQEANKPIMVLQTNGGAENQSLKYSWMRDLPIQVAQQVVDHFKNEYTIFHIRREDQLALNNTIAVQKDFRSLCALIQISSKRLFIDSFAQHVAKALDLDSTVCWIGNTPVQFGYETNTNILANIETRKPELKFSVFNKYNISGDPVEFPYNNEDEIFNVDEIIASLSK
jgi:hypothetical protein